MKGSFYGYLLSFLAILVASFVFLFGLAYWNARTMSDVDDKGMTTCMTSSGEAC
jgi:hypothetical protein